MYKRQVEELLSLRIHIGTHGLAQVVDEHLRNIIIAGIQTADKATEYLIACLLYTSRHIRKDPVVGLTALPAEKTAECHGEAGPGHRLPYAEGAERGAYRSRRSGFLSGCAVQPLGGNRHRPLRGSGMVSGQDRQHLRHRAAYVPGRLRRGTQPFFRLAER